MSDDPTIQSLQRMFGPWQSAAAANAFPPPKALAVALEKLIPQGPQPSAVEVHLQLDTAKYFPTAAIDIWHRAVQSLLVSIALSRESALWSTVCAYYATHYTFRGLAHLLGYYQLFQLRWMVHVRLESGEFVCTLKNGRNREHEWYRKVVSADATFRGDPFFASPA